MLDKVEYWLGLADDDLSVAGILLKNKKYMQAGFFCHLITEKALKAIVANTTSAVPPKTHNLTKLAERGGIFDELSESQMNCIAQKFCQFGLTLQKKTGTGIAFPI